MPNYTLIAATAKRLIEANGRTVTLIQRSATPSDGSKPWRGTTSNSATTSVKACFVDLKETEFGYMGLDENFIRTSKKTAMIACASLVGSLESYHEIQDGTEIFRIVEVKVLQPSDVPLIYFVRLE